MTAEKVPFGCTAGGAEVTEWRVRNSSGASFSALDYGAAIRTLTVPDRNGVMTDVVLGYDTAEEYGAGDGFVGATIGRVGNRIGGGRFSLDGTEYVLAANDRGNHLHGGVRGFDKRMWKAEPMENGVAFWRMSPDGEEGYPGDLLARVAFTLTEDNALHIVYEAAADADTPVNLTNHSYFNLAGGGSALGHELTVNAESFLENDKNCLPTGRIIPVEGTPFDFRSPKPVGRDIDAADEQLAFGGGYDHCYVLASRRAAELRCPQNGIVMTVFTDMPGMQVYSANNLGARRVKGGSAAGPRDAVCLETQLYPDGMAHYGFPSPVLRSGEKLRRETVYAFGVY